MPPHGYEDTNVSSTPPQPAPYSGSVEELVARLREERTELVREAHEVAADGGTRAKILRYMVLQGEHAACGYDELTAVVDVVPRTVRRHTRALDEAGLIERTELGPSTAVEFSTTETYVLSRYVLRLYER